MLYHPDVNPSEDAHRQFALINQAYHTLSDPQKRRQYDSARRQPEVVYVRVRPGGADDENARRFYQFMAHQQARHHAPPTDPVADRKNFMRDLITSFLVIFFVALVGMSVIGLFYWLLYYLIVHHSLKGTGWTAVLLLSTPIIFFFSYQIAKRLLNAPWVETQIERLTDYALKQRK